MSQIVFPGTLNADFEVDQVFNPSGVQTEVLDLDQGFTIKGHIDFPNWLSGAGNVSIYADQRGGEYNQKILSTDITITADPTDPSNVTKSPWSATYPIDLPPGSAPLSDPPPAPGSTVYSLTAVFTFNGVLSDISAFVDMGAWMIN